MQPTARSVILDLLSTLKTGTMPVAALVEAAALFGIPGNNVRVALARLRTEGRVVSDERGRYRLGPAATPVSRRLSSWRYPERSTRPWDGTWIGVRRARGLPRGAQVGRERALRLFGFRELEPGLAIRPANLKLDAHETRAELHALGLPAADLVFTLCDLDPATLARASSLWGAPALRARHRRLRRRITESGRRLGALPAGEAMVESFLLGGEAIRALALDPLLPEEIDPAVERAALAAAMRVYDRLGRSAWAAFLAGYEVPHRQTPVDTRLELPAA